MEDQVRSEEAQGQVRNEEDNGKEQGVKQKQKKKGKNIVVCCDGTGSEYGRKKDNTNIVKLFERLHPDGEEQISFYDPGVGTYSPLTNPLTNWLEKHLMMASGRSITQNVQKAYKYLMAYY